MMDFATFAKFQLPEEMELRRKSRTLCAYTQLILLILGRVLTFIHSQLTKS